jgi:hypothetical protein
MIMRRAQQMTYFDYIQLGAAPDVAEVFALVDADFARWDSGGDEDDQDDEPDFVWGLDCPPYIYDPDADTYDQERTWLELKEGSDTHE